MKVSSRLKIVSIILLLVLGIILSYFFSRIPDEVKFAEFNKLCKKNTTENIYSKVKTEKLSMDYKPWSGVIEDRYYPLKLAKELISEPKVIPLVQLLYETTEKNVVKSCVGQYVIEAQNISELKMAKCTDKIPSDNVSLARYHVKYEYGKANEYDIREFTFSVIDKETNETIAQQKLYQLLLGKMSSKNSVWYGWGSSQGGKVCSLTDPKEFLRKVFSQNEQKN